MFWCLNDIDVQYKFHKLFSNFCTHYVYKNVNKHDFACVVCWQEAKGIESGILSIGFYCTLKTLMYLKWDIV